MEKKRNGQTIIIAVLSVAILFMSVGFALFSQTLNINGKVQVEKASWDIHWDTTSFQKAADSVNILSNATTGTGTEETLNVSSTPTLSGTNIAFGAILAKPGDKAEFTVNAVNEGTFNAQLQSITMSTLSADQQKYLTYEITVGGQTYTASTNGLSVSLPAGGQTPITVKVTVKYIQPENSTDLPSTRQFVNLTAGFTYNQVN